VIVDASALLAVLLDEPEAEAMARAIATAEIVVLSAATYVEAAIVVDSARSRTLATQLDTILTREGIQIEPVTVDQARIAREPYRRYGRGSGHRARLNFGDCFAHALAKARDEPLLFKGDDFSHTDIEAAGPAR